MFASITKSMFTFRYLILVLLLRLVTPEGPQQILFRSKGRIIYTGKFFYVLFDINANALMGSVQPLRGEVIKVREALTQHLQGSINQTGMAGQPYNLRTHSRAGTNNTNHTKAY